MKNNFEPVRQDKFFKLDLERGFLARYPGCGK